MLKQRALTHLVFVTCFGAACSLVNSFDEVKLSPDDGGSGGMRTGGTGGQSGGMSEGGSGGSPSEQGGDGGTDQVGSGGTLSDAGAGGTAGSAGTATEGGSGGAPEPDVPKGLVVIGGTALDNGRNVLVAMDPETGEELNREVISGAAVVGLAHDGANRDAWFVFTANDFPADPMTRADLQVRRFDDARRRWSTTVRVTALPPPRPNTFVVLNERLAYLSYEVDKTMIVQSLTLLDTSDLESVRRLTIPLPNFDGELVGLVGARGVPGDATALGGTLAVIVGIDCRGEGATRNCNVMRLIPIFVGDEVSSGVATTLDAFGGLPAFASAQTKQLALAAIPPVQVAQTVRLFRFDPRAANDATNFSTGTSARWIGGLAYAECEDLAVMTNVVAGQLVAVSPTGVTAEVSLGRRGQDVVYDPFSRRVFAPYNEGHAVFGGDVEGGGEGGAGGAGGVDAPASVAAFEATRSGINVNVSPVDDFEPPTNLAPNVIAARFPVPFDCP